MAPLTTEQARALRAKRLREPLDVAPFLVWCTLREREIRREIDRSTIQIRGDRNRHSTPARPDRASNRLLDEIGWERESGERRMYRWANEIDTGRVERAVIEDALHHAGIAFYDIYPDLEPAGEVRDAYCPTCRDEVTVVDEDCPWCHGTVIDQRPNLSQARFGQNRKMTAAQLRAAHVIYDQTGRSIREVAELLYIRYGYQSNESCATSLRMGWKALGLARRDVVEATRAAHLTHGMTQRGIRHALYKRMLNIERHGQCESRLQDGTACPRAAKPGTTTCGYHAPDELARRRALLAQVNAEGKNTLRWAGHRKKAAA